MPAGYAQQVFGNLEKAVGGKDVERAKLDSVYNSVVSDVTPDIYVKEYLDKDFDLFSVTKPLAIDITKKKVQELKALGQDVSREQARALLDAANTRLQHEYKQRKAVLDEKHPDKAKYVANILAGSDESVKLNAEQTAALESGEGYTFSPMQAAAQAVKKRAIPEDKYPAVVKFMNMGRADPELAMEELAKEAPDVLDLLKQEQEKLRYTETYEGDWDWYDYVFQVPRAALLDIPAKVFSGVSGATVKRVGQVLDDPSSLLSPSDAGQYVKDLAGAVGEGVVRGWTGEPGGAYGAENLFRQDRAETLKRLKPEAIKRVKERRKDPEDPLFALDDRDVIANELENELQALYEENVSAPRRFVQEMPAAAAMITEIVTPGVVAGAPIKAVGAGAKAVGATDKATELLRAAGATKAGKKVARATMFAPHAGQAGELANSVRGARRVARSAQAATANQTRKALQTRKTMVEEYKKAYDAVNEAGIGMGTAKDTVKAALKGDLVAGRQIDTVLSKAPEQAKAYLKAYEKYGEVTTESQETLLKIARNNPALEASLDELAVAATESSEQVRLLTEKSILGHILKENMDVWDAVAPLSTELGEAPKVLAKAKYGVDFEYAKLDTEILKEVQKAFNVEHMDLSKDAVLAPQWYINSLNDLNQLVSTAPPDTGFAASLIRAGATGLKATNAGFTNLAIGYNPLRFISEAPANALMYLGFNGIDKVGDFPKILRYTGQFLRDKVDDAVYTSKKWGDVEIRGDEIDDMLLQHGVFDAADKFDPLAPGRGVQLLRTVGDKATFGANNLVRAQDNSFRKATFVEILKTHPNPRSFEAQAAAAQYVADTTVYLRDASPAFEGLGSFIPFFAFTAQANKLGFQMYKRNPGFLVKARAAQQTMQEGRFDGELADSGGPIEFSPSDSVQDPDNPRTAWRYDWAPTSYMFGGIEMGEQLLTGNWRDVFRSYAGPGYKELINQLAGTDEFGRPTKELTALGIVESAAETTGYGKMVKAYLQMEDAVLKAKEAGLEPQWNTDLEKFKLAFARATRGLGPAALDLMRGEADADTATDLLENLAGKPYAADPKERRVFDALRNKGEIDRINETTRQRTENPGLFDLISR